MTATPLPPRILVIKHGAFGDIIQSDGAFRDIRESRPDAEIVVMTTAPYRRILDRAPWFDRVMVDPRAPQWRLDRMVALARQLRREDFTEIFDLQNSTRTAFYRRWLLPRPRWFGAVRGRTMLLRAERQRMPSLARMAATLAEASVAPCHVERPDLSWMAADVGSILAEAGVDRPFVVMIPGSSAAHPEKRWPFYPDLASRLLARGLGVVMAPGPDEKDLVAGVPGTVLTGPNGFLNWFELAGLFKRAVFVVGNDTGPTHLAAHCGAAGLALFGPHTTPEMTGILRENFEAITVADLKDLAVERVEAAIVARLPPSLASPS